MAREKGMGNLQQEKSGRWTMRVGINGKRYCRSTRTKERDQAVLSQANSICSNRVWHVAATNAGWKALSGKIVGGDSGDPAFLLIGDEPILLYCLHYGGVGSGPPLHHHRKEIQKAMDDLCPGYKLEMFNFRKVGL